MKKLIDKIKALFKPQTTLEAVMEYLPKAIEANERKLEEVLKEEEPVASFFCPLCSLDHPHTHTSEAVAKHQIEQKQVAKEAVKKSAPKRKPAPKKTVPGEPAVKKSNAPKKPAAATAPKKPAVKKKKAT